MAMGIFSKKSSDAERYALESAASKEFTSLLSAFESKHIFGSDTTGTFFKEYSLLCEPPHVSWWKKCEFWTGGKSKDKQKAKLLKEDHVQLKSVTEKHGENEYETDPNIEFLPLTLLPSFIIEEMINNIDSFRFVPTDLPYTAVLLVVDVSGFTPLTEVYNRNEISGAEDLATDLNIFMSNLASTIMSFGGDILSFAGDAYLCQWVASSGTDADLRSVQVFNCAVYIQTMLQNSDISRMLRVKIGIALGATTMKILGSPSEILLYAVAGETLIKVRNAEEYCGPGEIVVSEDVYHCLVGRDVEVYKTDYLQQGYVKFSCFPRESSLMSPNPHSYRLKLFKSCGPRQIALSRAFTIPVLRDVKTKVQLNCMSEVSRLTILFVFLPDIDVVYATNLDRALQVILLCIQQFEGVLSSVLLFDKGCTFLAIFGLPGLKHLDDASRAVFCADSIIQQLKEVHNMQASTAISSGTCFCGIVGHFHRREYSVIGWRVNMASRLMTTYPDEAVVLDADTYHLCLKNLGENSFVELEKRKLKGIQNPPNIYAYHKTEQAEITDHWDTEVCSLRSSISLVAEEEHEKLRVVLVFLSQKEKCDEIKQNMKLPVISIEGASGSGRSFMVCYATNIAHMLNYQIFAFKAMPNFGDVPYGSVCFVLQHFLGIEPDWVENIKTLLPLETNPCLFVLNHLLNFKFPIPSTLSISFKVIYKEIGRLLKLIFQEMCTPDNPLLIAIDDANHVDSYSWLLLHQLVETENVVLLLSFPKYCSLPCSAAAMVKLKAYHKVILDTLDEVLIPPMVCWSLGVEAIHEDIIDLLKFHTRNDSRFLAELILMPEFKSFIKIVPKSKVDPQRFSNCFVTCRKLLRVETEPKDTEPLVCDLANKDLDLFSVPFNSQGAVKRRLNTLGIQDRVILKLAAVLGFPFSLNTFKIINANLTFEELEKSIRGLLKKDILSLMCCPINNHNQSSTLSNLRHCTYMKMNVDSGEVWTRLINPEPLDDDQPLNLDQKIQFSAPALRSYCLKHMTKEQKMSMHIDIAEMLEKRGLLCQSCLQEMNEFCKGKPEASEDPKIASNVIGKSDDMKRLQLAPIDLRKCTCLNNRIQKYELISTVYQSAGILLLSLKYIVKCAEMYVLDHNPIEAVAYVDYGLKTFPSQHCLENYIPSKEEIHVEPQVIKASLYRMRAKALLILNQVYEAASNAIQAIEILDLNILDYTVALSLNEVFLASNMYTQMKRSEIAECLSVLCITYCYTSGFDTAYRLAIIIEQLVSGCESTFIENLEMQCLYYHCKTKVTSVRIDHMALEKAILNTCYRRLVGNDFPVDVLELREIAKAYVTIITQNLNQRKLGRAERRCREGYRIMNCVRETIYTPRILSLAIEVCFHCGKTKILAVYLNHLRGYAIESDSKTYMALYYCGTIKYLNSRAGIAAPNLMDRLRQCETFMTETSINYFPLYEPQDICYFVSANLAWWCMEPQGDLSVEEKIFFKWYKLARSQQMKSAFQSYWHLSAELTMIHIDIVITFSVCDYTLSKKLEEFTRITEQLKKLRYAIMLKYPVLERTWRDLIEELEAIWMALPAKEFSQNLLDAFQFLENSKMLLFAAF